MFNKLLIVSNNALSMTKNNGKTLESFLNLFDNNSIAQLYLSNEVPNSLSCNDFFQICEKNLIKCFFHRKKCGEKQLNNFNVAINDESDNKLNLGKFSGFRIIRELLWLIGPWKSLKLINWLEMVKPSHLLFCAGDSIFAYRIVNFICKKYNCKLIVYYTDDYYFQKMDLNIFNNVRKKIIKSNITKFIKKCDLLLTVSPVMKDKYFKQFNKDSVIAANMYDGSGNKKEYSFNINALKFCYAGSMYYGRDKMLLDLAKSLDLFNKDNNTNHVLNVYSQNDFNSQSNFICLKKYGKVNQYELKKIFNDTDIFVFVESFDQNFIARTHLSFSTKIPEYLSFGKCILSYAPIVVGSVDYLKESAYCITNKEKLNSLVNDLCKSEEKIKLTGKKCYELYINYNDLCNPEIIKSEIMKL